MSVIATVLKFLSDYLGRSFYPIIASILGVATLWRPANLGNPWPESVSLAVSRGQKIDTPLMAISVFLEWAGIPPQSLLGLSSWLAERAEVFGWMFLAVTCLGVVGLLVDGNKVLVGGVLNLFASSHVIVGVAGMSQVGHPSSLKSIAALVIVIGLLIVCSKYKREIPMRLGQAFIAIMVTLIYAFLFIVGLFLGLVQLRPHETDRTG